MIIREMKFKDFKYLVEIENDCFKHPWKESDLLYEVNENPINKIFVYDDNEIIKGFINIWITYDTSSIAQIGVKSEYRHQGIATKLYEDVEKLLRNSEVQFVTLEVRISNENAIKFYEKMGFNQITVKKAYYTDGEDAIYMVKELI